MVRVAPAHQDSPERVIAGWERAIGQRETKHISSEHRDSGRSGKRGELGYVTLHAPLQLLVPPWTEDTDDRRGVGAQPGAQGVVCRLEDRIAEDRRKSGTTRPSKK